MTMTTTGSTGTTPDVDVPDAPPIRGLRFRRLDLEADVDGLVTLINDCSMVDRVEYALSAADVRHDFQHQRNFDLARDVVVAELDGRIVGEIEGHIAVRDGVAVHEHMGWVHPEHRRRGIGRALVRWFEVRAREAASEWSGEQPRELGTWIDSNIEGGIALVEREGYRRIRYGFLMIRPLSEPIPDAPLPAGLELRPVVEADRQRIWDADDEAFRDHWAAVERTQEDFERWFTMPNLDTNLWRVAWDGDEVAGSVWTLVWPEENAKLGLSRGWLEHISVRRPWRRRGLATALIAETLRLLRDLGLEEGALGVDSENLTGALRLYESLGFRRHRTGISFRKPLAR
jgi:mycothiol synthase